MSSTIGTENAAPYALRTPQSRADAGVKRSLIVLVTSLGVLLGLSGTASAAVTNYGGYASTHIACSQTMYEIRQTVDIRPQTGYRSQSVAFRTYIENARTGSGMWTDWAGRTAPFYNTFVFSSWGETKRFYMQYAWYNGRSWSYSGEWITSYTQFQGARTWSTSYCYT